MRIALALVLALSGCAVAERVNPLNLLGSSSEEAPASLMPEDAKTAPTDDRSLVAEVTQMRVNPTPDGAIVEAYGTAPSAGAWDPELVALDPEGGVLTLEFRVRPIRGAASGGSAPTLLAGRFLSDRELAGISTIRVAGAGNARTSRR